MSRINETLPPPSCVPLIPEELDAAIGDQIAITDFIGRGGIGAVYKGQQIRLGRTVAVKLLSLSQESEGAAEFVERFLLEARTMGRLSHPNVVRVHDFGETDRGLPYIVMEYVDGVDLASLIRGGELTVEHIASWVPQACEALEYAHNHELVHRAIKPGNIMINREGMVKIADFGLVEVNAWSNPGDRIQTQVLEETSRYLAPEVMEDFSQGDHRADVFSMGVVLYEMLTGRVPQGAWRAPSQVVSGIGAQFDAIVARAMQAEPSLRYSRIADLGRDVLAASEAGSGGEGRLITGGAGRPKRMNFGVVPKVARSGQAGLDR